MDIQNTLEVTTFISDIFKVGRSVLEDGKVKPVEVALEGRKLLKPGADAIRGFQTIPQEILDLDGEEYEILKAALERVKSEADALLAVIKANKKK